MLVPFDTIDGGAKLWLYQSSRALSATEVETIEKVLTPFAETWVAHGVPLYCSFKVLYNVFIVIAIAETDVSAASGCSIDKSAAIIGELEQQLDVNFRDRLRFAYLSPTTSKINFGSKADIKEKIELHILGPNTMLFDNTIQDMQQLRTIWPQKIANTWLATSVLANFEKREYNEK